MMVLFSLMLLGSFGTAHFASLVGGGQLGAAGLLLLFESVYERLHAALDAGGDAARDRAGRRGRRRAGVAALRGRRACHQTLLIAQLGGRGGREERREERWNKLGVIH